MVLRLRWRGNLWKALWGPVFPCWMSFFNWLIYWCKLMVLTDILLELWLGKAVQHERFFQHPVVPLAFDGKIIFATWSQNDCWWVHKARRDAETPSQLDPFRWAVRSISSLTMGLSSNLIPSLINRSKRPTNAFSLRPFVTTPPMPPFFVQHRESAEVGTAWPLMTVLGLLSCLIS